MKPQLAKIKALTALAIVAPLILQGCRSVPESPDAEAEIQGFSQATIRPLEPRIDAIAGRPFLTPVRLTPPTTPLGAVDLEITIDGDVPIEAELLWINRTRTTGALASDPLTSWLEAPTRWEARTVEQLVGGEPPPGSGFWALRIDCPASAHQRTIYINGRAAPVQWLRTDLPTPPGAAAQLFQEQSPELRRALTNAERDPLNRWRVRLLEDRFHAPRRTVIDAHNSRFDHDAIETMAEQAEWRWRLALDRVSDADPFLGAELLDRLTSVAEFEPGVTVPIWPVDDAALTSLRSSLLDDRATDAQIIERTKAALLSAPSSTAWVIDDAGWVQPSTGRTVSLVGIVERTGKPGLARTSAAGGATGPMATLPAFGVTRNTVLTPSFASGQAFSQTIATTSVVGRDDTDLPLLPLGLPIETPGFRLGPGLAPWTLSSWTAMAPRPAPGRLSFYALLHRRAGERDGWQLHVECPVPAGADPGMLRVHLGPSNEPIAILRIDPAGLQQDQLNAPLERDHVSIREEPGLWVATVNIPENAIEQGGILRLAIERFNDAGERATWPRPVMPWQQTPGRAALDCGAWNSLGTGEF